MDSFKEIKEYSDRQYEIEKEVWSKLGDVSGVEVHCMFLEWYNNECKKRELMNEKQGN